MTDSERGAGRVVRIGDVAGRGGVPSRERSSGPARERPQTEGSPGEATGATGAAVGREAGAGKRGRDVSAYGRALDLLTARAYTVRGLRRKLLQKELPRDEVDAAIERLVGAGLLDDANYALAYARTKLVGTGASARRVRQELARKGVAADVAGEAVEQVIVDEEVDTEATAVRVARKKLASMGELEPLVLRRRVYAFLARRGYDIDDIQKAMQEVFPR